MQSGNPLYRPELYKQPPRGYSGPIWVRFFAKNTFRICAGATKNFFVPFHNFLAPYGPFFSRGGHFLKYVVRIWEMLGRTAVVMILPVFTEHKGFCPHIWDSDHIFQKGIYINIEWLWLLDVIICTHQCTMISRLIVISPFQICSAVVFNAGACSRLCTYRDVFWLSFLPVS